MLIYTPESVYKLDHAAVATDGFSEPELMQRAGERVWREIDARWPGLSRITVFAGAGNNGGDAFVVALQARAQGVEVQLLVQGDLSSDNPLPRVIFVISGNKLAAHVTPGRGKALAVS